MDHNVKFDYQNRAEAARQARANFKNYSKDLLQALRDAFHNSNRSLYQKLFAELRDLRTTETYRNLLQASDSALEAAYPPNFWADFERLRSGDDLTALETAIEFLEADPYFFRSGYVKEKLLRYVRSYVLAPEHAYRLQRVILNVVDSHFCRELREYCKLARKLNTEELRLQLESRLQSTDMAVQKRARWVLDWLAKA